MSRGSFFGITTLGPEDDVPEDFIRPTSPKHSGNRNGAPELRHDRLAAKLHTGKRADTHTLVEIPEQIDPVNMMRTGPKVMRVSNAAVPSCLKKGWRVIGPCPGTARPDASLDAPASYVDGNGEEIATTRRAELEREIDNQALEIRPGEWRTGRRYFIDGELVNQVKNHHDVAVPHGRRATDSIVEGKKP